MQDRNKSERKVRRTFVAFACISLVTGAVISFAGNWGTSAFFANPLSGVEKDEPAVVFESNAWPKISSSANNQAVKTAGSHSAQILPLASTSAAFLKADTFPLDVPDSILFDRPCPQELQQLAQYTNPNKYLQDLQVNPGALMPQSGELTSWTRYFTDADGAELQVAIRRVELKKWVVRARKTKPDGSLEAIELPGHSEEPLIEADARKRAQWAHDALLASRPGAKPRARTMVAKLEGKDGSPSLFEFDNGKLTRATLQDAAHCLPEAGILKCKCETSPAYEP